MIATNFVMERGKTLTFNVDCTSGNLPYDLTGATLLFMAKLNKTDPDASAVITSVPVVADPPSGVAQVQILSADTANLTAVETVLYWAVQVTSAGNPFTVAEGLLTIEWAVIVASS